MTATTLAPSDLVPFAAIAEAKATELITDALGTAAVIAPCIFEADFAHPAAAKAILREAVLRRAESGTGGVTTKTAGPFAIGVDTTQKRAPILWPSEITALQNLCKPEGSGGAFQVDTAGSSSVTHADICTVNFGGQYCSCGAILTQGLPLYEW